MTSSRQAIQGYDVQSLVAQGGFGAVYRAVQPGVGRQVAIKVILPQYAAIPAFVRRFEVEAQLVARLEHPHIVPLYDYWREPGGAYLVMRWMQGGNLAELLRAGPLPPARAVRLLEQVADALSLAHRRGVLHRDIKPANVLLDAEGNAYLADFGIALATPDDDRDGSAAFTPGYAAPEQLQVGPLSPRTDLYSLGLVLYEMLTGSRAFASGSVSELLHKQLTGPRPSLAGSGLPAALDVALARALARDPAERFADVLGLSQAVRTALAAESGPALWPGPARAALDPAYATVLLADEQRDNPYKGLRSFQEADAADFFGRTAAIAGLLKRLAEPGPQLLAVVGPSGSGKSSLVRAGLLPALRRGALPGSQHWYVAELTPGGQPFAELERTLLGVATHTPPELLSRLRTSSEPLSRLLDELLPTDPQAHLLLLIDQFEALFTQGADEAERGAFLALIERAARDTNARMRFVLTLRADFYDRPLLYPGFGALLRERTEVVLPLAPVELAEAISRPAQRVGAAVAPELVAEMVNEVATRPGALPLLQYALTELFASRRGRALTLADYHESGGIRGALARRADAIYAGLDTAGQAAARQIFLRLVTPGEGAEDTRRRVRLVELESITATLPPADPSRPPPLEAFGAARLLTFDHDPLTREPTVEVAHEALLRSWARLRGWVDGAREELRVQRGLSSAAAEWRASGRDGSFLAGGARLSQFLLLASAPPATVIALSAEERAFLDASSQQAQAALEAQESVRRNELAQAQALAAAERRRAEEQATAGKRLRWRALWLGLALSLALLALGAASWFGYQTQLNAVRAAAERDRAERALAVSDSQRLAFAAQSLPERSFETRMLLAIEAARRDHNLVTERTLRATFVRADGSSTVLAHPEPLIGAQFSADGSLIAALSATTLTIWDLAGHRQAEFHQPARTRSTLTLPDNRRFVTGDEAGVLRLFDISNGLVQQVQAHAGPVFEVDASRATGQLVSVGGDGLVRLWSPALTEVTVLRGHTSAVYRVEYSEDGSTLVTIADDGSLRLWDGDGTPVAALQVSDTALTRLDVSPDNRMLAVGDANGTLYVWEVAAVRRDGGGAQPLAIVRHGSGAATVVTFRSDSRYVLVGNINGSLAVYSVDMLRTKGATVSPLASFSDGSSELLGASFSPDGSRIVTVGRDAYPVVLGFNPSDETLTDLTPLATLYGHQGPVVSARFSPDGQRIISASADGTARVWVNVAPPMLQDPAVDIDQMTVSPDGSRIVTISESVGADRFGRTQLWDGAGNRIADLGKPVTRVDFDPQGSLVVTGDERGRLTLWSRDGQRVVDLVGHTDFINSLQFSRDGAHVLSASTDATARLWDRRGRLITTLQHDVEVVFAEMSLDGARIVTAAGNDVRLWGGDGRLLKTIAAHTAPVHLARFNPDGKQFATASGDGTARIWDREGNQIALLQHADDVFDLQYSDDGARLMTTSLDMAARVWDRNGLLLLTLQHRAAVGASSFTPDGATYVTTSGGTVYLWNRDGIEIAAIETGLLIGLTTYLADEGRTLVIVREGVRHTHPIAFEALQRAAECTVGRGLSREELERYQVSEPLRFVFGARTC